MDTIRHATTLSPENTEILAAAIRQALPQGNPNRYTTLSREDTEVLAVAMRQALAQESKVYSPKFWPRAFAIMGHQMAAGLVFYAAFMALILLLLGAASLAQP